MEPTLIFHSTSRRRFLANSAAVAAASASGPLSWAMQAGQTPISGEDEATPYKLFFDQPATTWPDSLPVGNGRLGACVFGNPAKDRIQLNEESIWDGEVRDRNNPQASPTVEKLRQLLFAGKVAEAEALVPDNFLAIPRRMPCYQTLGDLHLDFGQMDNVTNYRLELNLDTAIATTTFTHEGVDYRREVFSSQPDQAIVVRLTASRAGKLSLRATLDRPARFSWLWTIWRGNRPGIRSGPRTAFSGLLIRRPRRCICCSGPMPCDGSG